MTTLELLRQAEAIWTQDTKWSENGSGNNLYKSSGSVVSAMMKTPNTGASINLNTNVGCGGFAAMISDYIFGRDNNNFHKVSDISQIRPSDIIIRVDKKTNEPVHAFVTVSTPGGTYTSTEGWTTASTRAGYIHITNGNSSDKIKWPTEYSAPIGYIGNEATNYNWLVYSRYPDAGTSETPTTSAPTTKEIQVSSNFWSGANSSYGAISGNAWTVGDNKCGDGYLNNGKPITEANVLELLRQAEGIWIQDTKWSESGSSNNFYKNSSTIMDNMLSTKTTGAKVDLSANFGCGGYAAMISDYIFGSTNNNFHKVSDINQIRPGDIIVIVEKSTNKVIHVKMAISKPGGSYTSKDGWTTPITHDGYMHFTEGNLSDKISWPTDFSSPSGYVGNMTTNYNWLIYSRYPT